MNLCVLLYEILCKVIYYAIIITLSLGYKLQWVWNITIAITIAIGINIGVKSLFYKRRKNLVFNINEKTFKILIEMIEETQNNLMIKNFQTW